MQDAGIQMALALTEAVSRQLNNDLLAVDLHTIRHRLIGAGQDDAAKAIKLLILAAQLAR